MGKHCHHSLFKEYILPLSFQVILLLVDEPFILCCRLDPATYSTPSHPVLLFTAAAIFFSFSPCGSQIVWHNHFYRLLSPRFWPAEKLVESISLGPNCLSCLWTGAAYFYVQWPLSSWLQQNKETGRGILLLWLCFMSRRNDLWTDRSEAQWIEISVICHGRTCSTKLIQMWLRAT